MYLRHFIFVSCILIAVSFPSSLPGQDFYSYMDENGIQVFTNIPPVNDEEITYLTVPDPAPGNRSVSTKTSNFNPESFDSIIQKYARYYQLDPSLIHSIIATESNFNPNAVSSKGARGLMQLMPATAERLGVEDSFDPEQNIHGGVKYLRSLMDMFDNNLDLSLAAYNAGENLVLRLGRIPGYEETIQYVETVTDRYREKLGDTLDREGGADAPTFRYLDDAGVLHLTNIPPSY